MSLYRILISIRDFALLHSLGSVSAAWLTNAKRKD